jgi:uncharacterized protein
MRFWLLLTVVFAFGSSLAQPLRLTPQQIAQYIDAAQLEVIVAAPVLRVTEVADALRRASAKRGISVKVLTGAESLRDAASYFWVLKLAGAEVRTVSSVKGFELILDRRTRITGDLIGRLLGPDELVQATLEQQARGYAKELFVVWFKAKVATGF